MPWSRQIPPRARNSRAIPSSEIRAQLERILTSPDFDVPDRAHRFLRYVVTESLSGRADRIKAYTIAVEVFGRVGTFDPQSDPVVRIEAGRVRRGLERYYLTAGSSDPIVDHDSEGRLRACLFPAHRGRATGFGSTQVCVASGSLSPEGAAADSLAGALGLGSNRPCPYHVGGAPMAGCTTHGRSALARPRCPRAEYPETSDRAVSGCDWDRGRRNHRHRD